MLFFSLPWSLVASTTCVRWRRDIIHNHIVMRLYNVCDQQW